jgi:hypothetical protein
MIARFMTHDPAREYMNPYAYVAWNPVKFTDPTGMVLSFGGLYGTPLRVRKSWLGETDGRRQ